MQKQDIDKLQTRKMRALKKVPEKRKAIDEGDGEGEGRGAAVRDGGKRSRRIAAAASTSYDGIEEL
jgi:hypothetical protein